MIVGVYDVSFEIKEGEIFVIMGFFGLGKLILVWMLNCLIDLLLGNIYLDGKDIVKMNVEDLCNICCYDINMVF